jgi:hypothetical protein
MKCLLYGSFAAALGLIHVAWPQESSNTAVRLTISGVAGRDGTPQPSIEFSAEELRALPRRTTRVRDRNGKEHTYEGVLLADILKRSGQPLGEQLRGSAQLTRYLVAIAHDGYRVLFSVPEVDPEFSANPVVVADRVDGDALPQREGPLRVIVPGEKREARWIRMLERIEVLSAPEPLR